MQWNRQGISREVLLTRRLAIKLPKLTYGWRYFLVGLLANMREAEMAASGLASLCPVVFYIRGGWLVVMRRAEPLTDAEWHWLDELAFRDVMGPAEIKRDSFGRLDGRIVVVDYGGFCR